MQLGREVGRRIHQPAPAVHWIDDRQAGDVPAQTGIAPTRSQQGFVQPACGQPPSCAMPKTMTKGRASTGGVPLAGEATASACRPRERMQGS
jgi:hypothetical protein